MRTEWYVLGLFFVVSFVHSVKSRGFSSLTTHRRSVRRRAATQELGAFHDYSSPSVSEMSLTSLSKWLAARCGPDLKFEGCSLKS